MTELTYHVPDVSCDHCVDAITAEVTKVTSVSEVLVDVPTKRVTVHGGDSLDDALLRAAIDEAGYDITG